MLVGSAGTNSGLREATRVIRGRESRLRCFSEHSGDALPIGSYTNLPQIFHRAYDFSPSACHTPPVRTTRCPGGTRTDLRGLPGLGQDARSQCTEPAWEEWVRASSPLQRALAPAALARASVLLASRAHARGVTGAIVTVDAGVPLHMPRRTGPAGACGVGTVTEGGAQ